MDTSLHRFAASCDGVVTVRAAARLGYGWPTFRRLIADEGWRRLGRGAYLAPGAEPTLRARVRAEQMHRPLVASHRTAAALLGADVRPEALEFVVQGSSRFDVAGGTVRRTTWQAGDVGLVGGLLVTSPARTATDLLRDLPRDDAVVATDALLRARAVTLDEVAARMEQAGRRYARRAWRAFRLLDPRSGSPAESYARLLFEDAHLYPRTQVVLRDDAHRRVRVDFWFPEGVVVEVEGFAFHATRDQHQADVDRFNALARLPGQTVLRFTYADVVRRPRAVLAATRQALAGRAERTAA